MEINLLHLEVQSVEKLIEPKLKKKDDEEFIGVISEYAKKLYTLWMLSEKEIRMLTLDYQYGESINLEEYMNQSMISQIRSGIFEKLFWYICRIELSIWSKPLAIRKGWIIVIPKDSQISLLDKIVREILGEFD